MVGSFVVVAMQCDAEKKRPIPCFRFPRCSNLIGNCIAVILAGESSPDFAIVERVDDVDDDGAVNGSYGGDQLYCKPRSYYQGARPRDSLSTGHRDERSDDEEQGVQPGSQLLLHRPLERARVQAEPHQRRGHD